MSDNSDGFTIIEVLIVLAIAGLIMLIVFLAIPALQRNQRNSARNNDASRISSAVSECLANRNGQTSKCQASDVEGLAGNRSQLTDSISTTPSLNGASLTYSVTCDENGESTVPGGARDFAVQYKIETSGGSAMDRCIGSTVQ